MGEVAHVEDHEEHAQALLIDQYQEKPRIAALLASYTTEIQAAEDMLWDVRVRRFVDDAEGDQLDTIGRIVGEERSGRTDDIYRVLVLVRISLNKSDGKPDDVISILRMLSGTPFASALPLVFRYDDYYPASFDVDVHTFTPGVDASEAAEVLAHVVRSARAAGVHGSVLVSSFAAGPATNPEAYTGYDEGEGDVANPNATTCLCCYDGEDLDGPSAGIYE